MSGARLAMAVLLFLAAPAHAVYKWVDEKGRTHYSEEPPPDGRKADKVELKVAPPSGAAKPVDWKQRELEMRKKRLDADQKDEYLKARSHNEMAERRNRCAHAQRELEVLSRQRPVYSLNDQGERVYLDDKDRPAREARWREEVRTYCDSR